VCSQGCPGLSFRAGSLKSMGAVCWGRDCLLPGSALSLPGELPMAIQGEPVGRRNDPRQGRGAPSAVEGDLHG